MLLIYGFSPDQVVAGSVAGSLLSHTNMSTSTKMASDKEPKMTGEFRRPSRKLAVAVFLLFWNPGARALSAPAAPADALPLKVNGSVTPLR
jgi:hypothetical protein